MHSLLSSSSAASALMGMVDPAAMQGLAAGLTPQAAPSPDAAPSFDSILASASAQAPVAGLIDAPEQQVPEQQLLELDATLQTGVPPAPTPLPKYIPVELAAFQEADLVPNEAAEIVESEDTAPLFPHLKRVETQPAMTVSAGLVLPEHELEALDASVTDQDASTLAEPTASAFNSAASQPPGAENVPPQPIQQPAPQSLPQASQGKQPEQELAQTIAPALPVSPSIPTAPATNALPAAPVDPKISKEVIEEVVEVAGTAPAASKSADADPALAPRATLASHPEQLPEATKSDTPAAPRIIEAPSMVPKAEIAAQAENPAPVAAKPETPVIAPRQPDDAKPAPQISTLQAPATAQVISTATKPPVAHTSQTVDDEAPVMGGIDANKAELRVTATPPVTSAIASTPDAKTTAPVEEKQAVAQAAAPVTDDVPVPRNPQQPVQQVPQSATSASIPGPSIPGPSIPVTPESTPTARGEATQTQPTLAQAAVTQNAPTLGQKTVTPTTVATPDVAASAPLPEATPIQTAPTGVLAPVETANTPVAAQAATIAQTAQPTDATKPAKPTAALEDTKSAKPKLRQQAAAAELPHHTEARRNAPDVLPVQAAPQPRMGEAAVITEIDAEITGETALAAPDVDTPDSTPATPKAASADAGLAAPAPPRREAANLTMEADGDAIERMQQTSRRQPVGSEEAQKPQDPAQAAKTSAAVHKFASVMSQQAPAAQVAFAIARSAGDAPDRIRVNLFPDEMGQVEVLMDVHEDRRTDVVVRAERPETVELLQRDARELQRALQMAGLDVNSNDLSFEQGETGNRDWKAEHDQNDAKGGDADDEDFDAENSDVFAPAPPRWRAVTPGGIDMVA